MLGNVPVDDALVGTYTLANTDTSAAFGGDAIGLGLEFLGQYTELPLVGDPTINIQTFNPALLGDSTVIFLSLRERSGSGPTADVEVGPNARGARGR